MSIAGDLGKIYGNNAGGITTRGFSGLPKTGYVLNSAKQEGKKRTKEQEDKMAKIKQIIANEVATEQAEANEGRLFGSNYRVKDIPGTMGSFGTQLLDYGNQFRGGVTELTAPYLAAKTQKVTESGVEAVAKKIFGENSPQYKQYLKNKEKAVTPDKVINTGEQVINQWLDRQTGRDLDVQLTKLQKKEKDKEKLAKKAAVTREVYGADAPELARAMQDPTTKMAQTAGGIVTQGAKYMALGKISQGFLPDKALLTGNALEKGITRGIPAALTNIAEGQAGYMGQDREGGMSRAQVAALDAAVGFGLPMVGETYKAIKGVPAPWDAAANVGKIGQLKNAVADNKIFQDSLKRIKSGTTPQQYEEIVNASKQGDISTQEVIDLSKRVKTGAKLDVQGQLALPSPSRGFYVLGDVGYTNKGRVEVPNKGTPGFTMREVLPETPKADTAYPKYSESVTQTSRPVKLAGTEKMTGTNIIKVSDAEGYAGQYDANPTYIEKFKNSIKNGEPMEPITIEVRNADSVVNGDVPDYKILDGHHRLIAAKELGYSEIPVRYVYDTEGMYPDEIKKVANMFNSKILPDTTKPLTVNRTAEQVASELDNSDGVIAKLSPEAQELHFNRLYKRGLITGEELDRYISEIPNRTSKVGKVDVGATKISEELFNSEQGAHVFDELDNAAAGRRFVTSGEEGERVVTGIRSTFPDWVPSNLRNSKLFGEVKVALLNGDIPKSAKAKELYNIVSQELQKRADNIAPVVKGSIDDIISNANTKEAYDLKHIDEVIANTRKIQEDLVLKGADEKANMMEDLIIANDAKKAQIINGIRERLGVETAQEVAPAIDNTKLGPEIMGPAKSVFVTNLGRRVTATIPGPDQTQYGGYDINLQKTTELPEEDVRAFLERRMVDAGITPETARYVNPNGAAIAQDIPMPDAPRVPGEPLNQNLGLEDITYSTGKPKEKLTVKVKDALAKAEEKWTNRYAPIEKWVKQLTGGGDLANSKNPVVLIKRYLGGQGIANAEIKYNLEPILRDVDNADDFKKYLIAARDNELNVRMPDKFPRADKALQELRAKIGDAAFTKMEATAQKLYDYQRGFLDELHELGVLNDESYLEIIQNNKKYIPFKREMDDIVEEFQNLTNVGSKNINLRASGLHAIKGSEKEIIDPLESIVGNTYELRRNIERQRVLIALRDLGGLEGIKVQGGLFEPKQPHITMFENGQKVYYEVPDDVARAINGMDEETLNTVTKILSFPAKIMRAGATGLNVGFSVPNMIRDQLSAAVNSKYGGVPIYDFLSGLASTIKQDDAYKKWLLSGADQAGFFAHERTTIQRTAKELTNPWLRRAKIATNPLEILRIIGEFSEKGSRVGVFKRALKGAEKSGMINEDAILDAMQESREATIDFARRGSAMKAANAMVPFLNARIQGSLKLINSATKRPVQTLAIGGGLVTVPSVLLYLHNSSYPEYDEIPPYIKQKNFIIMTGNKDIPFVKIPKGEIGEIFGNPTEAFLAKVKGDSGDNWATTAGTMLKALSPVDNISSVIPTSFLIPLEIYANYSFFKDQNIVSPYLESAPAELQVNSSTSETAKWLGGLMGASPAKVQHGVEGLFAGLGKQATQISDAALFGKNPEIAQIPGVNRFIGSPKNLRNTLDKAYEETQKKATETMLQNDKIKKALMKGDTSVLRGLDKQKASSLQSSVKQSMLEDSMSNDEKARYLRMETADKTKYRKSIESRLPGIMSKNRSSK